MDSISCLWVLNDREPSWFSMQGTNDKYEHIALFLHAFHNRDEHCANIFISDLALPILRAMMCFYKTAAAVEEKNHATEVASK